MTTLVKKTRSRLAGWFKKVQQQNRPPYKWYEHDHYGI